MVVGVAFNLCRSPIDRGVWLHRVGAGLHQARLRLADQFGHAFLVVYVGSLLGFKRDQRPKYAGGPVVLESGGLPFTQFSTSFALATNA